MQSTIPPSLLLSALLRLLHGCHRSRLVVTPSTRARTIMTVYVCYVCVFLTCQQTSRAMRGERHLCGGATLFFLILRSLPFPPTPAPTPPSRLAQQPTRKSTQRCAKETNMDHQHHPLFSPDHRTYCSRSPLHLFLSSALVCGLPPALLPCPSPHSNYAPDTAQAFVRRCSFSSLPHHHHPLVLNLLLCTVSSLHAFSRCAYCSFTLSRLTLLIEA